MSQSPGRGNQTAAFDQASKVIIFTPDRESGFRPCHSSAPGSGNEDECFHPPVMGRVRFALTPMALIDAIAILPLYSRLDALRIAGIVDLLEMKVMPPRSTIVEKGEKADAMYFISVGEVVVDILPEPQQLQPGGFFGEIALLTDSERTATVTTVTECQLLVLYAGAFKRLLASHPEMRQTLTKVMEQRLLELEGRPA